MEELRQPGGEVASLDADIVRCVAASHGDSQTATTCIAKPRCRTAAAGTALLLLAAVTQHEVVPGSGTPLPNLVVGSQQE
jgi:hypothetical protein